MLPMRKREKRNQPLKDQHRILRKSYLRGMLSEEQKGWAAACSEHRPGSPPTNPRQGCPGKGAQAGGGAPKSITLSPVFFLLNLYNYIISLFLFLSPTPPFLVSSKSLIFLRQGLSDQAGLKLQRSFCICLFFSLLNNPVLSDLCLLSLCLQQL